MPASRILSPTCLIAKSTRYPKMLFLVVVAVLVEVGYTAQGHVQQQQCGELQRLDTNQQCNNCKILMLYTVSRVIIILFFSAVPLNFTVLFNQSSYAVSLNYTAALSGIPIVPFTVFISEAVTSAALSAHQYWLSVLYSDGSVIYAPFGFQAGPTHPFPANFPSPLVGKDTIFVLPGHTNILGTHILQLQAIVFVTMSGPIASDSVDVTIVINQGLYAMYYCNNYYHFHQ